MVSLYKDPKGEEVFGKYETPSFKSQTKSDSTITGTTDSALKRRVQELENIIATNQVKSCISIVTIIIIAVASILLNCN